MSVALSSQDSKDNRKHEWLYLFRAFQKLPNYRPQTKFAKVMFLQVSVHTGGAWRGLFGGACVVLFGGVCVVLFRGHAWFIRGACVVLFGGACMVLFGGMCGFIGGHVWFYSGVCMVYLGGMHGFIRGGCARFFQFFRMQSDTVNERAVRILLECILVKNLLI